VIEASDTSDITGLAPRDQDDCLYSLVSKGASTVGWVRMEGTVLTEAHRLQVGEMMEGLRGRRASYKNHMTDPLLATVFQILTFLSHPMLPMQVRYGMRISGPDQNSDASWIYGIPALTS